MLPFRENIHALSVPMPNQVTERALRALARASEVVIHSRRRCQLVDRGRDGGGGIETGRVSHAPGGATQAPTSRKSRENSILKFCMILDKIFH